MRINDVDTIVGIDLAIILFGGSRSTDTTHGILAVAGPFVRVAATIATTVLAEIALFHDPMGLWLRNVVPRPFDTLPRVSLGIFPVELFSGSRIIRDAGRAIELDVAVVIIIIWVQKIAAFVCAIFGANKLTQHDGVRRRRSRRGGRRRNLAQDVHGAQGYRWRSWTGFIVALVVVIRDVASLVVDPLFVLSKRYE